MEFLLSTHIFEEGERPVFLLQLSDDQCLAITDHVVRLYENMEGVRNAQPIGIMQRHPDVEEETKEPEVEPEQTEDNDDTEDPPQGQMPLGG